MSWTCSLHKIFISNFDEELGNSIVMGLWDLFQRGFELTTEEVSFFVTQSQSLSTASSV
jgi:hypothetical protein